MLAAIRDLGAYEESPSILMNLIKGAQINNACLLDIRVALDRGRFVDNAEVLQKQGTEDVICRDRLIYLPDDAALKAEIMRCYYDNLHTEYYA